MDLTRSGVRSLAWPMQWPVQLSLTLHHLTHCSVAEMLTRWSSAIPFSKGLRLCIALLRAPRKEGEPCTVSTRVLRAKLDANGYDTPSQILIIVETAYEPNGKGRGTIRNQLILLSSNAVIIKAMMTRTADRCLFISRRMRAKMRQRARLTCMPRIRDNQDRHDL